MNFIFKLFGLFHNKFLIIQIFFEFLRPSPYLAFIH